MNKRRIQCLSHYENAFFNYCYYTKQVEGSTTNMLLLDLVFITPQNFHIGFFIKSDLCPNFSAMKAG